MKFSAHSAFDCESSDSTRRRDGGKEHLQYTRWFVGVRCDENIKLYVHMLY